MAKKQNSRKTAGGGRKAAGSRGGRAAGGARGRKAASRKPGARKSAARKSARPAAKTAKKKTARGAGRQAARKRTGGRAAAAGRQGRKSAPRGEQVSRSTSRAKWVESPDDLSSSRAGETLATRNHDVIRKWAEERGGQPSTIPGGDPESPRVLRLNFPGFGGENLQPVEWDEWFSTFDDRKLVFLFQERLKNGNQSNFFRLDNPDREDA